MQNPQDHEQHLIRQQVRTIEEINQLAIDSSKTKFIFVTGGVISSLGKGVAGASLGALLKAKGYSVSMQKLDPYLNTDAGTMNPLQHGEVFVTDDGAETDMDLGHYERFLDQHLPENSCFTSGYIYSAVIKKERSGRHYRGQTIQIVPHITNEIKHYILRQTYGKAPDIVIVEIGGTVGDIEGLPFCEAVHELRQQLPPERSLSVHLTYVPYLESSGETKTKPTQHSVKELRAVGLQPDIIICRCKVEISPDSKRKIARSCGIGPDAVFTSPDVKSIYELPEILHKQRLVDTVSKLLDLRNDTEPDMAPLENFTRTLSRLGSPQDEEEAQRDTINILIVGKYVSQDREKGERAAHDLTEARPGQDGQGKPSQDILERLDCEIYRESYKSVHEALCHAGVALNKRVEVSYIESDEIKGHNTERLLSGYDGVLIPGGFDFRGTDELIMAIGHARRTKLPFFGICFGLQLAVIEYARGVLGMEGATSEEFFPTSRDSGDNVIYLMERWFEYHTGDIETRGPSTPKGGTMRLGLKPCLLIPGSKAYDAYRNTYDEGNKRPEAAYHYPEVPLRESHLQYRSLQDLAAINEENLEEVEAYVKGQNLMTVYERHRHRFEINPAFHKRLTDPSLGKGDHLVISGEAPKFRKPGAEMPPHIVEIMELKNHPWFLGCQFHPEFLSRPLRPHPLFLGFIGAAIEFHEKSRPRGLLEYAFKLMGKK
ncbi:MAG: CTP synthase [Deltaproteobacteria bacterium]|jgi:CTP synthase|nr:CTP synthase [Deltaproteobacteria bacterium]